MIILLGFRFFGIKKAFQKHAPIQPENIKEAWHTQSGNWHWLREKPVPVASINRTLWRASVPSFSFYFLLGLSAIIATLGLLANSVAIIIGAMIIAPLIGLIMGISYSSIMANRRLLKRSSLTLITGIILTILLSGIVAELIGLETVGSEIRARANPTLIDLGIAMAAGAAGSFANTRRRIADALPGVAIAVALVPPLSVVGIGLGLGETQLAIGSSLLFLTNLTSIIFCGGLVFLFQSYGSVARAKQGLFISICMLIFLALPLSFSMKKLITRQNVRSQVHRLVRQETVTFSKTDIRSIKVNPKEDYLTIELEIATSNPISEKEIGLVRDFMSEKLGQPLELKVKLIPMTSYQIPVNKDNN